MISRCCSGHVPHGQRHRRQGKKSGAAAGGVLHGLSIGPVSRNASGDWRTRRRGGLGCTVLLEACSQPAATDLIRLASCSAATSRVSLAGTHSESTDRHHQRFIPLLYAGPFAFWQTGLISAGGAYAVKWPLPPMASHPGSWRCVCHTSCPVSAEPCTQWLWLFWLQPLAACWWRSLHAKPAAQASSRSPDICAGTRTSARAVRRAGSVQRKCAAGAQAARHLQQVALSCLPHTSRQPPCGIARRHS